MSFLDGLIGGTLVKIGGVLKPKRKHINLIGATGTDNAATDSTDVILPAATSAPPVATLAELRALSTLDGTVTTGQTRHVAGDPIPWVYDPSTGANFTDDGATCLLPNDTNVLSNGRWYRATSSPILPTIAALRLAVSGVHQAIHVQAYATKGDGGGGIFDYDASDTTSADNGGTIIVAGTRRYKRRYSGAVSAAWFGARFNVVTKSGVTSANGSPTITVAGLTAADIGKKAYLRKSVAPFTLIFNGTISNVVGTTVTLSGNANASTTCYFVYGTDDTAAIQAAWDASDDIYHPIGTTFVTFLHALARKHIHGAGSGKTIFRHVPGTASAVMWLGNNTDDVPPANYQGERFNVHGFAIHHQEATKWGIRCRELAYSNIREIYTGASQPDQPRCDTTISLLVDGILNCHFENIDCLPGDSGSGSSTACQVTASLVLAANAGSGSGAGATSSKFVTCYFHYANVGFYGTGLNNVTRDQCVYESNNTYGAHILDVFKSKDFNPYAEHNGSNAFFIEGSDTRTRSLFEIEGGYTQRNTDGGYINTTGAGGKPYLKVKDCDRVRVTGVQALASIPIVQFVEFAGTNEQVEIEAQPWSFRTARQATNTITLNNAIATTNGSASIKLTFANWAAAGILIGTVFDLSGATSPLNAIPVNRPYWIVTATPDANTLTLTPILFGASYTANATTSGLGGAAIVARWYAQGDWAHVVIPSRHVKLVDCDYETIRFTRTFNSIAEMSSGGDLYYDGQLSYKCEAFTYVYSAQLVTDQPIVATNPTTRYLQPSLSGAGFDSYVLTLLDHAADSLAVQTPDDLLYRAFPGQSLSLKIFMSGDHDERFPRTETVDVVLAKTRYTIATEA